MSVALLLLISMMIISTACNAPENRLPSSGNQPPQQQAAQQAAPAPWKRVDEAMGRTGTMMPGDVYRFSMPRSDLKVVAKGVEIKPALALGSWAASR